MNLVELTLTTNNPFMELILILAALILSFAFVVITIPPILRVAKAKHLYDHSDDRKIHSKVVPPLGGVAIFIGFILATIIATDGLSFDSLKYIIAAVMIMFFIGLKDDLLVISARKKLLVQLFASLLLITLGNVRFTTLHGILWTNEIGYLASLSITLLAMVVIINSFNLIDGIDGLASGLAILASFVLGTWFYIAGHFEIAIMSFALVGSLTGFFFFNVFGKTNKLFMGDTGSLIVGMVISILIVRFNEYNIIHTNEFAIGAAPAVSFAIIIVPLIDTLRVMSIRIWQRRSPFSPDNNHIHHRLLVLVPNHFRVSMIIIGANVFLIAMALLLNNQMGNINLQFILIFLTGVAMAQIPSLLIRIKGKSKNLQTKTV